MTSQTEQGEHGEQNGEAIRLFTERTETADSTMPVRWCLHRDILDYLKTERIKRPYLLLVVKHQDEKAEKKTERILVPLDHVLQYIQFKKPGIHRIAATVVWHREGNRLKLQERFLGKDQHGSYELSVLNYSGELRYDLTDSQIGQHGKGTLEVDVADEFFARERPKWMQGWVNLAFETVPRDECQFRKRCLFAFTVQPLLELITMLVLSVGRVSVALFLTLCSIRGVAFRPILHPFRQKTREIWSDIGASPSFLGRRTLWPSFLAPPIVPLVTGGTMFLLNHYLSLGLNNWLMLGIIAGATLLVPLLVQLIGGILYLLSMPFGTKAQREEKRRQREREERLQAELERQKRWDKQYSILVCEGVPLEARLDALPRVRRTVYLRLRLQDLKARLCRPFAR